jgi:hypothetical protein
MRRLFCRFRLDMISFDLGFLRAFDELFTITHVIVVLMFDHNLRRRLVHLTKVLLSIYGVLHLTIINMPRIRRNFAIGNWLMILLIILRVLLFQLLNFLKYLRWIFGPSCLKHRSNLIRILSRPFGTVSRYERRMLLLSRKSSNDLTLL